MSLKRLVGKMLSGPKDFIRPYVISQFQQSLWSKNLTYKRAEIRRFIAICCGVIVCYPIWVMLNLIQFEWTVTRLLIQHFISRTTNWIVLSFFWLGLAMAVRWCLGSSSPTPFRFDDHKVRIS